ncbi:MAG TPA: DNA polymerase domain-containing protein [Opitutales bacterium]|nr:DNA polymerase domain-containing protein [Opitutales bacterium]
MRDDSSTRSICGLWVDPAGDVFLSLADSQGGRREIRESSDPFCWVDRSVADADLPEEIEVEKLSGPGKFDRIFRFRSVPGFFDFVSACDREKLEWIRSLESQFLISNRETMFAGMRFSDLRRCQCDIETACSVPGGFSNPKRGGDRILAIGLQFDGRQELLVIGEKSDEGERQLLRDFSEILRREDPDTIEGHNIFRFDLEYLRIRSRRLGLSCDWGRFGKEAQVRRGWLRVAERSIAFPRFDIPGRLVFDTYLMVLVYDLAAREMSSYGLKEVAQHLGISGDGSGFDRTYLEGNEIQNAFENDRKTFLAYLADDLRETAGVADLLLPTYFAQASSFPMTLQDTTLRGSGGKVDLMMLQEYAHAKEALPENVTVGAFEGGFTRNYETGVFKNVWHFDVASLYPSLLLNLGRNPAGDSLGAFIPLLEKLREYRLRYKNLARAAENPELKTEYDARQNSYKILINSFYGYLGFSGARFADGELAAAVTREGRELLQELIKRFQKLGCTVLEADTDGIYLVAPQKFEKPEMLLEKVTEGLPSGIELEFDGHFPAMFCYKAKNYALYNGKKVLLRGSALRSRGMEPYLQDLTSHLIRWKLGLEEESPKLLIEKMQREIAKQEMDIDQLVRFENLGQDPEKYRRSIEEDPEKVRRRSSLEAALKEKPIPKMGDRIGYFIAESRIGGSRAWERAFPVSAYDPKETPYDAVHYLRKLDEWEKRYEEFFTEPKERFVQGELF